MVTGLRAFAGAEPSGECELHRCCAQVKAVRGIGDDDDWYIRGAAAVYREHVRSTFTRARDMAEVSQVRWWKGFLE